MTIKKKNSEFETAVMKTAKRLSFHFPPEINENRETLWRLDGYVKPFDELLVENKVTPKFGFFAGERRRLGNYMLFQTEKNATFIPCDILGQPSDEERFSRFVNTGLYKTYEKMRRTAEELELFGIGSTREPDLYSCSLRLGFKNELMIELTTPAGAPRQKASRWIDSLVELNYPVINIVRFFSADNELKKRIVLGKDFIIERLADISLKISAGNNPHQNAFAVENVALWLKTLTPAHPDHRAILIGAGSGLYTLSLANAYLNVSAVAVRDSYLDDLDHNARFNSCRNVKIEKNIEAALESSTDELDLCVITELAFLAGMVTVETRRAIFPHKPRRIALFGFSSQQIIEFAEASKLAGYKSKALYVFEYVPSEKIALFGLLLER